MPPRRSREDDTIIVKGDDDEEWAAPSSPESIGSDIDFEPKNKMAIDTPQDLESPEPEQADGASVASVSPAAKQSSKTKPKYLNQISFRDPGSSTMEERLQMMPAKRPLPWRDGVEAGSELETGGDSRRKQIRFGCLLATRGNEVETPCHSCANGRGKFELCIALPGFFKGACASCQLSGRPNRCSIKTNEDIEPEEFHPEDGLRSSPVAEESSSDSRRASGSGSRKNTAKETPDRSTSTTRAQEDMNSGPPAKRARVEEPEKLPQTGWQEPPVVDTGLGSAKSRGGRPPRSSLNNVTTSWAHVNSPHMATRNSSTPINTRNGGSRRSVGQTPSADKETIVKETSRKPSNTPSTNTPQSAPSRSASNGWASVNQTQQGSQPTFPNLAKPQIPKPQHQQSKPEQPPAKPVQQVKPSQEQYQAQQQQQVGPPQEQYQAQQKQQVVPPQEQYQAQQHQQHQVQQQQQPQHQVQQQPQPQHQVQQQQQQQQQYQLPPPPPPPQAQQQHGRPQPQFQVQPNTIPPNAFGGFVDQQNGRMSNGLATSQPPKKVKQLPPYQPTFVTTPSGLSFASAPLIETLPKRKQLQLMGIISGLQGGIDNIQRELNQLKKTLGVEDDDN
ncbi:a413592f-2c14-45d7-99ff-c38f2ef99aa2 [Sclerotinia trifoliorum]|uniref:A413592f-2c14-45d7-99ff-c38f2ef99aa2 n=1 Tax=Sclerotinia trifoliorum TaxID=28548 RepID=A0A8H2ZSV1_9HELO|nr:a413592f-2c14-45d7-99ff-c38f2ef99aa2 [Sclerotinia trifoliorum]